MDISKRQANYDKFPEVKVIGYDSDAWAGYIDIIAEISNRLTKVNKSKKIIVVDCYHGVNEQEIFSVFADGLKPSLSLHSDEAAKSAAEINEIIQYNLTDDRVFGVMYNGEISSFFDTGKIRQHRQKIDDIDEGIVLIYGFGAALIVDDYDILVYADLARWEIQQRFRRKELGNWKVDNIDEDILRKYKRSFFIDWRIADRHKKGLFEKIDYLLDTNCKDQPKMITGTAFLAGLKKTAKRPFRVVPFFDPGVWGGQWMKQVCNLDPREPNYAWCFDCVPEENSLYLRYGDIRVEIPSIDLVFYQPVELLGDKVHARFGTEFPIRFDFLDTMGGQNLSLQVHPLTEYIQENFGMNYTQDESYYMLDAGEDAVVYLGVKEGIDKEAMLQDLEKAQAGESSFPDYKYINKFPAAKHDHFLIPGGTIHCSGANSMVLEISATPYIFTFKLWDWERVGLDGLPRPIHIEHGKQVIQWQRDTQWVKENLVNVIIPVEDGDGWREEKTGLHDREFIETRRHCFTKAVCHHTNGGVNVLNLVEGEEAIVESPSGAFDPFIVHYAETFIIPAAVGEYTISPYGKSLGQEIMTIKAYVRT